MSRERTVGAKKVIGLDFGTLSARALLVGVEDGEVYAEASFSYPHGVLDTALPNGSPLPEDYALAHPADYLAALRHCVKAVMAGVDAEDVIGLGVDATTYSMVPCLENGEAMCLRPEFSGEPMAYIKLWKHHAAKPQAARLQALHTATGALSAIERCGGVINCEWALPKLLETYEKAPSLAERAYRFCDLGEWLVWQLTGKPVNSMYSLGFKCMWAPELAGPDAAALERLNPGFSKLVEEKLLGPPSSYNAPCGRLTESIAAELGLKPGTAVAAPIGDGSAPGVYFGLTHPKAITVTYGTSIAMAFLHKELKPISGINGVAKDGIVPGFYGYDAGQPCAGDMLDWFAEYSVPEKYARAAKDAGMDIHTYLTELAAYRPWQNKITVLDWFNGNRGILNDMSLRGSILGLSLGSRPEDIYGAMVQGIACGTRRILEHLTANGIDFDEIIVCGGVAEKNAFAIQQYANILGRELYVSRQRQLTARSAAILAAIAAGVPPDRAAEAMASAQFQVVAPDREHGKDYEAIYRRWTAYHDMLSQTPY